MDLRRPLLDPTSALTLDHIPPIRHLRTADVLGGIGRPAVHRKGVAPFVVTTPRAVVVLWPIAARTWTEQEPGGQRVPSQGLDQGGRMKRLAVMALVGALVSGLLAFVSPTPVLGICATESAL